MAEAAALLLGSGGTGGGVRLLESAEELSSSRDG